MFSFSFSLSLVLAFVIGSVWVTIVTVISERSGSAIGGTIGGLPSTVAFSFLFIGFNQSTTAVVEATTVYPLAFSFTCLFLLFYAFSAKKGFFPGISISLALWFLLATLIFILNFNNFVLSLISGIIVSTVAYFIIRQKLEIRNMAGRQTNFGKFQLIERAIIAGSLVFLAVFLSQVIGTIIGGIFSAFPAVYTSTLYILSRNRDITFSRAMTKPLLLSGLLTVLPYCVVVRFAYPIVGIWIGTAIAFGFAAPMAFLGYRLNSLESKN